MKKIGLAPAVILSAASALAGGRGDGALRVGLRGLRGDEGQVGGLLLSAIVIAVAYP
jgi:hypothetical protein